MIEWLMRFILGPKCPLCGTRNMYPLKCGYNLKKYWCDFCFTEFTQQKQ